MTSTSLAFPLAVAISSIFLLFYLGINVSMARKSAKIPYPYMYATAAEVKADPFKNIFNCAQRAHQNTLENYPSFLVLLGIASLNSPTSAGYFGLIYLAGRFVYALGYTTGTPANRNRGVFSYIGLIGLLYHSILAVYQRV